jgi:SAM-dependent methyltransferase
MQAVAYACTMSAGGSHPSLEPSPWIVRFAHLVPVDARVLDLACGHGRHARLFAGRGARVLAVDRDADALSALAGIRGVDALVADLEAGGWPLGDARFDAIVVTNYLHRPLFAPMLAALAPDGALLYETFAAGNEAYGRPSNPAFLLERNERAEVLGKRLTIVAFEQGHSSTQGRDAVVQRVAAVGTARAWPPLLRAEAGDAA